MRFNLRWLLEYLQADLSYEQILDALTTAGLEVEESLDLGMGSGKVVFGKILEINAVPGADKIRMTKITVGGPEPLNIICGAHNIEPGHIVPVALIGAKLPNGMAIEKRKVMGNASEGMLCSASELRAAEDASGIWLQDPENEARLGQPFDAIVEINITPNRPDALSLVGVARDLAAKSGGKVILPEVKFEEIKTPIETMARVIVEPDAKTDCPRYAARVIRNVTIGPSPIWLQRRLEAAGLRPRNNVVDVTNYVMLELGHPLHAFDLDTLNNRTVVVRHAKDGERMRLLDDTQVELKRTDLLIADPQKPIALAGIMGGGETEISDKTTNVLLEAAYFRPQTIRATAKRLGKSTDASYRFERGTDYKKLVNALHRAAQLIQKVAGGEVLQGHLDVMGPLPKAEPINLRIERARALSGLDLTGREISDILKPLGFEILRADPDKLVVIPPSHRPDVEGEADLIEEVARITGFDRIPAILPEFQMTCNVLPPRRQVEQRLADVLVGLGASQAVNFSFVAEGANVLAGFSKKDSRTVRLANPMTVDQAVMRRSLVPGLLANAVRNFNNFALSVALFEIGRSYAWVSAEQPETEDPKSLEPATEERHVLTVLLAGEAPANWRGKGRDYDFYDIKGVAEALLAELGIARTAVERVADVAHLHPGRSAALTHKRQRLATFGEIHPAVAKELDVKKAVFVLEVPLTEELLGLAQEARFRPLPTQMASARDLALVLDRQVAAQDVERTIRGAARELLESVRLFDVYEGKGVAEGKRSLAFSLTFRHTERTLTDQEITGAMEAAVAALKEKHGAELR